MKPRLMKNAMTISQMVVFEKPDRLSLSPTVPVSTLAVMAMMATAPIGAGLMIRPTMVAAKMANICHAFASSPAGTGQNHRAAPTANVTISIGQLTGPFAPSRCLARADTVRGLNAATDSTGISFPPEGRSPVSRPCRWAP